MLNHAPKITFNKFFYLIIKRINPWINSIYNKWNFNAKDIIYVFVYIHNKDKTKPVNDEE